MYRQVTVFCPQSGMTLDASLTWISTPKNPNGTPGSGQAIDSIFLFGLPALSIKTIRRSLMMSTFQGIEV